MFLACFTMRWGHQGKKILGIAFVGLLATTVGCSKSDRGDRVETHPVKAAITFQGKPIPGAFVVFHPKTPQGGNVPNPRGMVSKDGHFSVTTFDGGDGAPAGDYVLTVQWYKPIKSGGDIVSGPNVIPRKYTDPKTSDVVIQVAAGENNLPTIRL